MRVKTTPLFERTLDKFINCTNDYYSRKTVKTVFSAINHYRNLLRDQPHIGAEEEIINNLPAEVRHIVIKPYFKLIYTLDNDEIFLIDLWDTRQSPENLRERISHL